MKTFLLLLLSIVFYSCESIEKLAYNLFLEEDLLQRPKAKRCSDCHTKIYNQWKNSRHSVAWISEHFKKSTENYSKVKCLSCHAPYEIEPLEKPKLRDFHREDGINCVSCHFKDSTNSMHGPYEVFSPPHYSTKDINYTKSEICAGCHRETYKEWKSAKVKQTCQDCHMPSKKDNLIQKFPFYLFHKKKDVHNHEILALLTPKDALNIKLLSVDEDEIKLMIENTKIPHNLPTADQGKPKFYIKTEFFLNNKKVDEDLQMITHKQGLKYKKPKELSFFTTEKFNLVKITISRKLSWSNKKETIKTINLKIEK